MKKNKLVILLIVLAGLLVVYFGLSAYNKQTDKKKQEKAESEQIHLVDADELTKISYTDGSASMAFTCEDGTWYYDNDKEIPINQSTLEEMEKNITDLVAARKIKNPDGLEDYGLTSPLYQVTYTGTDGSEHTIHVGNTAGENYYVSLDDEKDVYTIDSTLTGNLVFDLKDVVAYDEVPSIGSGNIKKVEVTQAEKTTTYKEEEDLNELAGGFGTLSLTDCVDYHVTEDSLSKYGLAEADRITAVVTYKDSESEKNKTFTVYIGKATDDGANRYIMVDGSKMVYQVSKEIVNNMITVDKESEN